MNLNDLPASELARIDAVCLDYESRLRLGELPSLEELVSRHGGVYAELLRTELELVRDELAGLGAASQSRSVSDRSDSDDSAETVSSPTAVAEVGRTRLPLPGTRIGPYEISRELGRGGMGVVFAAVDTRLDRPVAIKMLAVEISQRHDLTARFQREARAVAALSHPNIVELFDVGTFGELPYAVMEFLDGEALSQRLARGPMEAREVRQIGAQIADALATAHEAKVIHRDLKPQNVMLVPRRSTEFRKLQTTAGVGVRSDGGEIVKLFDFGLSRAPDFDVSAEETGNGLVMGTPGYMSPEQVRGETVTPAADLFSLGCILFEAFYGHRAFDGRTNSARFSATLHHDPQPDPLRRNEDVPLADLIQTCLDKDEKGRPQSAAEVATQLRSGFGDASNEAADAAGAKRLNRRIWLAAGAGGIAGLLIVPTILRRQNGELTRIRSLGVLAFLDKSADAEEPVNSAAPIGDRDLQRGEQLGAMLVHELTRLSEVKVPRFRPLTAESPQEFRELGQLLEVDALLTGSMRTVPRGSTSFLELNLEIVSSKTGNQLWGKTLHADSAENLLQLSSLASEVADVIGQRLTSSAEEEAPLSVESFNCLVSGGTRSDPDSRVGLETALSCFRKAHAADRTFAAPLAGIALTSMTLAAQSETEESVDLLRQARESAEEALELDATSLEARLTLAMLDWQSLGRFQRAEQSFQDLTMSHPNHWQLRHQHGLFLLATHRWDEAMRSLREAWQLHPLSMSVKVDHARAHWFGGNAERAIQDATRLQDRYDSILARGLLVDILEQQQRYDLAAELDDELKDSGELSKEQYLSLRRDRLADLPYGPFGPALNEAIWKTRTPAGLDDLTLADLTDPMLPMLPLLLSNHPGFIEARELPRAKEFLPEIS